MPRSNRLGIGDNKDHEHSARAFNINCEARNDCPAARVAPLLLAPFQLEEGVIENVELQSPLRDRRRIDVEVGSTVVEVKRDLRRGKVKAEAVDQLAGYVERRAEQTGRRYVGVLTDGADWI